MIVQRFVMLLPGFGSFLKHAVIDKSGTAKGMSKLKLLFLVWKESELESLADLHVYIITQSGVLSKVIASEGDAKFIAVYLDQQVVLVDSAGYSPRDGGPGEHRAVGDGVRVSDKLAV